MHDQTYGTGLERDHPFRDIGLATKQAQNVAERMEMITAATKTAQNVANTKITTIINVSFPQIVVCLAETASIQRTILPLGFPSRFPPPLLSFQSTPLAPVLRRDVPFGADKCASKHILVSAHLSTD